MEKFHTQETVTMVWSSIFIGLCRCGHVRQEIANLIDFGNFRFFRTNRSDQLEIWKAIVNLRCALPCTLIGASCCPWCSVSSKFYRIWNILWLSYRERFGVKQWTAKTAEPIEMPFENTLTKVQLKWWKHSRYDYRLAFQSCICSSLNVNKSKANKTDLRD